MPVLAPVLRHRYLDSNGGPLAGGKLYSYIAGTTTPKLTYATSGGSANTNPIILDANGEADIWIGEGAFKFVLYDADDVLQWSQDNIEGALTGGTGGLVRAIVDSSPQAVTANTTEVVVFDTETIDELNQYNPANGRYTATQACRVLARYSLQVIAGASAPTSVTTYIQKNGTGIKYAWEFEDGFANNEDKTLKSFAFIDLVQGDYIDVYCTPAGQDVSIANSATHDVSSLYIFELATELNIAVAASAAAEASATAAAASELAAATSEAAASASEAAAAASEAAAATSQSASTDSATASEASAAAAAVSASNAANAVTQTPVAEYGAPNAIATAAQVGVTTTVGNELQYISGDGGNIDALAAQPIANGAFVGQELTLFIPPGGNYIKLLNGANCIVPGGEQIIWPGRFVTLIYVVAGTWALKK